MVAACPHAAFGGIVRERGIYMIGPENRQHGNKY
jgi:hypothetical protein